MKHEGDSDNWCVRNNQQNLSKETWILRNQRTSRDHRNYSIIKIGQNTEKDPGDLRKHKKNKLKLATVVEGDSKAPFSIVTTQRYGGVLLHSLDCSTYPWSLPDNAALSKVASSTICESLVWLDLGFISGLLDHWRTLYALGQCKPQWKTIS